MEQVDVVLAHQLLHLFLELLAVDTHEAVVQAEDLKNLVDVENAQPKIHLKQPINKLVLGDTTLFLLIHEIEGTTERVPGIIEPVDHFFDEEGLPHILVGGHLTLECRQQMVQIDPATALVVVNQHV